jgi:hypothetical protein
MRCLIRKGRPFNDDCQVDQLTSRSTESQAQIISNLGIEAFRIVEGAWRKFIFRVLPISPAFSKAPCLELIQVSWNWDKWFAQQNVNFILGSDLQCLRTLQGPPEPIAPPRPKLKLFIVLPELISQTYATIKNFSPLLKPRVYYEDERGSKKAKENRVQGRCRISPLDILATFELLASAALSSFLNFQIERLDIWKRSENRGHRWRRESYEVM